MTPWALQAAVKTRLDEFTALNDIVGPVLDHATQDEAFPYVVIGDDTHNPLDTHSTQGSDSTITIHTWSRYRGKKETKEIQREIYNALHRYSLVVAGVDTVDCQFEFGESLLDEDGLTRHGIQRFRVLLDEG